MEDPARHASHLLWLRFPAILGGDIAGVVEEVGPGVTRFRPGDPVFAMLNPGRRGPGGYAEFAVTGEPAIARKPAALSFEEAASMPIAGLTALQSLRDLGQLSAGQSVLVNGASGGVGTFAVPIARALGARVTGVCGPTNVELIRGLGADEVIDYTREDFTRRSGEFDIIFDAVAKASFSACARSLRPNGMYITTLPSPGVLLRSAVEPIVGLLGSGKRARFVIARARGPDLELLGCLADEGKLRPVIDRVFSLDEAKKAHDFSESERAKGKIVLRVV